jgi:hypothetical protein
VPIGNGWGAAQLLYHLARSRLNLSFPSIAIDNFLTLYRVIARYWCWYASDTPHQTVMAGINGN